MLSLSPEHVSDRYKTGGTLLERPLSSGKHDFETDKSKWPLTKPVSKVEALIQCAGTLSKFYITCFYQNSAKKYDIR